MDSVFATILAAVAVVTAWLAQRRAKRLERRLSQLERLLDDAIAVEAESARPVDDVAGHEVTRTDEATESAPEVPDLGSAGDATPPSRRGWKTSFALPSLGLGALGAWMRANWIYPVAGAALVMAAVFLVQYWIERGVLTPEMRILLGLGLGLALIGGAELLRRRWGAQDSGARAAAATLAGAGIGALFASVLAAFHLYAMLGQGATLGVLAGIAVLALVLGWVHGPLLAGVGILGAAAAPFLLGPGGSATDMLYTYFAVVALAGMAIDGLRRWGWVAPLAVIAPVAGMALVRLGGASDTGLAIALGLMALMAMALPGGTVIPRGEGPMLGRRSRADGPTRVAALALALCAAGQVGLTDTGLGALALISLALIHPLWTLRAPAQANQVLLPVLGAGAAIALDGVTRAAAVTHLVFFFGWMPMALVALSAVAGLAMLWRSETDSGRFAPDWALVGIAFPGAVLVAFELFWQIGAREMPYPWALTAMALAALYTAIALWAARRDAGQGLRVGAAAAAALSMIAMAMTVTLSLTALTLALAVLLVASAAMDRRFDLPVLAWFTVLATMALGWRLVMNPGLSWALSPPDTGGASDLEIVLTLLATLGAPAAALVLMRPLQGEAMRDWARVVIETALASSVPIAVALVMIRFLPGFDSGHGFLGIQIAVLCALALTQALRAARIQGSVWMRRIRLIFVIGMGAAALALMALVSSFMSPLFDVLGRRDSVHGLPILNDLIIGYALPGAMLWWCALHATWPPLRRALIGLSAGFWVKWGFLAIRHVWQGDVGMALRSGFEQGELYTYTVALLLAGAVALALALSKRQTALRVLGLGLIGVAAAKAFLIDASGLTGLLRVGAFLALGLSLAALAWLNGWVARRIEGGAEAPHPKDR